MANDIQVKEIPGSVVHRDARGGTMKKLNCWEMKNCGREPGGAHANNLGICSATVETRLDGIHDGRNAGRSCWVVAGTPCR